MGRREINKTVAGMFHCKGERKVGCRGSCGTALSSLCSDTVNLLNVHQEIHALQNLEAEDRPSWAWITESHFPLSSFLEAIYAVKFKIVCKWPSCRKLQVDFLNFFILNLQRQSVCVCVCVLCELHMDTGKCMHAVAWKSEDNLECRTWCPSPFAWDRVSRDLERHHIH